jgi:hypothetical protein
MIPSTRARHNQRIVINKDVLTTTQVMRRFALFGRFNTVTYTLSCAIGMKSALLLLHIRKKSTGRMIIPISEAEPPRGEFKFLPFHPRREGDAELLRFLLHLHEENQQVCPHWSSFTILLESKSASSTKCKPGAKTPRCPETEHCSVAISMEDRTLSVRAHEQISTWETRSHENASGVRFQQGCTKCISMFAFTYIKYM